MYHNIMNLRRAWYFIQVGHLNPRARMWPVLDSLMGRLVEFLVSHEVGNTLGCQHGPWDIYTTRWGYTPTSYVRQHAR